MLRKLLFDFPRHRYFTRLRRRVPLDDKTLAALYWRAISRFVPDVQTLEIAGREFEFGVSHLPEHYFFSHFDEHTLLADLSSELGTDDVFWDVGANIGVFTVVGAACTTEGTTVAFEPMPQNVTRLRKNLSRNGVDATVDCRALAAEVDSRELQLSSTLPGAQGNAVDRDGTVGFHGANATTVPVETVVGDSTGYPAPDVLKIDVEGAEYDVLAGLERTLASGACRHIYCEVHTDRLEQYGRSPDDVAALLTEHGYEIRPLGEQFDHRKRWKASR